MPTERRRPLLSARRSRRRHAHTYTPCRVRRVSSDITAPLRCIAGSALSEPTPAKPAERAPSRERVVVPTERRRPLCRRADRAVDTRTRTRRVVCAVCRVTSPRFCVASPARLCLSRHRQSPPSERRAASESSCRPSAADLFVGAPIAPSTRAHVHAVSCAPCVE